MFSMWTKSMLETDNYFNFLNMCYYMISNLYQSDGIFMYNESLPRKQITCTYKLNNLHKFCYIYVLL